MAIVLLLVWLEGGQIATASMPADGCRAVVAGVDAGESVEARLADGTTRRVIGALCVTDAAATAGEAGS